MALFYQSGRVSRFAVGTPGFSTETDLVLLVDGAIGVSTLAPRGAIDTPNISIRGDIIDSAEETGAIGYFLTQDVEGVRWIAASPSDLTFIRVFENGVQAPGFSSVSGLNFTSQDEYFLEVEQNPGDPNLADIKFNNPWIKIGYGETFTNFGLSTSFGSDGTFWSLPGYGTSEASGITSVGIGTDAPIADFQVGIGSTGVTVEGALGRLSAQIIRAKNLELDGNISAKSIVIDPGIATFRGNVDAQGISSFSGDVIAGVATVQDLTAVSFFGQNVLTGITTLGVGIGSTEFTIVASNFESQGAIGTFAVDLYVGNDLYVGGEQFVDQLNANNVSITGIATINEFESLVGQSTFFTVGVVTAGQIGFNTGIGTELTIERGVIGLATITDALIGVSTIGFADIADANISGIVTVTEIDVEVIDIERAAVGILTVGFGKSESDGTFLRTGVGTIVGFTTVTGDFFVDGDLTVTQQFTVKDLGAENLEVTGIGTIVNLVSDVGIVTTLFTEGQINTGLSTFQEIFTEELTALSGQIGGIDFPGSGDIAGDDLEFETGRIGILTGNILDYNIGIFTAITAGVGTISTITGTSLTYSDFSTINGVSFGNTEVVINQTLRVLDPNEFGIELGDISDPKTGLTTVAGDAYIGNDLYVGGEQFIKQLNTENINVSGIATINNLELNSGIATQLDIDYLEVGLGTITNLLSTASTITAIDARTVAVSTDSSKFPEIPGQLFADSSFIEFAVATNEQIQNKITVGFVDEGVIQLNGVLNVVGLSTFASDVDVNADLDVSGLTSTRDLFVSGIATINLLDVDQIEADAINTGIATVRDLTVTGVTTFQGEVTIEDIIFINQEVTGVSTVTNQIVTGITTINEARIGFASVGVATVGLLSATDAEISTIEFENASGDRIDVDYASIGDDENNGALNVLGVSTFTGLTTFGGDVFISGDLTVSGVTSFAQLDAEQSQIGILTVSKILDSNGFLDATNLNVTDSFQSIAGVSTLGFTTITDSLHIENNLYVGGITTFAGVVNIEETSFVNQEVTGISTVNELFFNIGIGTQLDVGILTAQQLHVTGVATFKDNVDIDGSLDVGLGSITTEDLYVTDQAVIQRAGITTANIDTAFIDDAFIITSTTGIATVIDLIVENATVTNFISSFSTFNGISTFNGNLDINADVDIEGLLVAGDIVATGISTINIADIFQLEADDAEITNAFISTSRIGFSSIGELRVGFGSTTQGSFLRIGVGTIVGFTSITGNLFVDGDLTVTGVQSVGQLDANQSRIGILTVFESINLQGDFLQEGTGISTFTDFFSPVGLVSTLSVGDLNVTGIATAPFIDVTDLSVQRNLTVGGISTLGAPGPTGFTTTLGDLYVGGDLFVKDDIFYDEIIGRNLFISGIGTIADLRAGIATISELNGNDLDFDTADIRDATILSAVITNLVSTSSTITTIEVLNGATISGLLTATGESTFNDNVQIDGELDVLGPINGTDIIISGSIAGIAQSFRSADITNLNSSDILSNYLRVSIAATFNALEANSIEALTLITGDILTANISNTGLTTTFDLEVYGNTSLEDLFVQGDTTFLDTVNLFNDLVVGGNIEAAAGIITALDISVGRNLEVSGVTTTTSLVVNGGLFYSTGLSTFANGLSVENGLTVDTFTANSGVVTTINAEEITTERAIVTDVVEFVNGNSTGIITANNLDVNGTAIFESIQTGSIDADNGDFNTILVDDLTFVSGIGSNLTLNNAGITTASIDDLTALEIETTLITAGIVTVTTELVYNDIVTTQAAKLDSFTATQQTLITIPAGARSVEFSVTVEDATDIHTTKITSARKGSNVFWNEYSTVVSNTDLATFDVVDAGGETLLLVTPIDAALTRFTVYAVAHI